jgi:hypothetical protein
LAAGFARSAFGLQGFVANQFAERTLCLAGNLFRYAFDLFAFHDISPIVECARR